MYYHVLQLTSEFATLPEACDHVKLIVYWFTKLCVSHCMQQIGPSSYADIMYTVLHFSLYMVFHFSLYTAFHYLSYTART